MRRNGNPSVRRRLIEFELHPLLRTFLQERLDGFGAELRPATVRQVGRHLLEHKLWNDALSLAKQFGGAAFLEALIDVSRGNPFWTEGRLATLSSLIDLAYRASRSLPST